MKEWFYKVVQNRSDVRDFLNLLSQQATYFNRNLEKLDIGTIQVDDLTIYYYWYNEIE